MDNAIMKKDLEEQASSISEIAKATQEVSSLAVHLAALVEKNSSVIDT
jgi:methyl-accepting chemotaxis protein